MRAAPAYTPCTPPHATTARTLLATTNFEPILSPSVMPIAAKVRRGGVE